MREARGDRSVSSRASAARRRGASMPARGRGARAACAAMLLVALASSVAHGQDEPGNDGSARSEQSAEPSASEAGAGSMRCDAREASGHGARRRDRAVRAEERAGPRFDAAVNGGDARAPAASPGARADLSPIRPDPMVPLLWAPSRGDECYSREEGPDGVVAGRRICDGPRRVPVPEGEALERAERLGLGDRSAVDRVYVGRAPPEWLAEIPSAPRGDLLWPVARGLFSRGFGFVRRAEIRHRPHNGVDIVAADGAHIRAVNDGLVVYADNGISGYGNFLVILHADGSASFYAHCRAIYAAPGQLVARGQVVAEVGATGRPYVPHLHFELRRGGRPIDPMPLFVERPDWREIRPSGGDGFEPPPPNVLPAASPDVSALVGGDRLRPCGREGGSSS